MEREQTKLSVTSLIKLCTLLLILGAKPISYAQAGETQGDRVELLSPSGFEQVTLGMSLKNFLTDHESGTFSLSAESGNTVLATVTVVKVEHLEYRIDLPGTADDNDPFTAVPAEPLILPIGTTVIFKAVPTSGTTWPDGKPEWGGVAGTNFDSQTRSVTFDTVSTSATEAGYMTVTAECGNVEPVKANVVVYSADIKVKRYGAGEADLSSSAIVAAGGKDSNEHKADVRVQLSPALTGIAVPIPTVIGGESGLGANQPGAASVLAESATTNGNGIATFTFKSSNRRKIVTLRFDNGQSPAATASIDQRWDDLVANDDSDPNRPKLWDYESYVFYNDPSTITFMPRFAHNPTTYTAITGHQVRFSVPKATVMKWNGTEYIATTYSANVAGFIVSKIDPLKTLADFDLPQPKDDLVNGQPTGNYKSDMTLHWIRDANGYVYEYVTSVNFYATDLSVFKP